MVFWFHVDLLGVGFHDPLNGGTFPIHSISQHSVTLHVHHQQVGVADDGGVEGGGGDDLGSGYPVRFPQPNSNDIPSLEN